MSVNRTQTQGAPRVHAPVTLVQPTIHGREPTLVVKVGCLVTACEVPAGVQAPCWALWAPWAAQPADPLLSFRIPQQLWPVAATATSAGMQLLFAEPHRTDF